MLAIVFIVTFGIIFLVGVGLTIFGPKVGAKATGSAVTFVAALVVFAIFLFGGMKSVPVKSLGVGQAFGTVNGQVFTAGTHETWEPWVTVSNIDETVQTTTFADTGNDNGSSCNGGLYVRIGGQQTACASITVQWQVRPPAASGLYQDYANQGDLMTTITNSVVIRELESVTNTVLGGYNPITDVSDVAGTSTDSSQFATFQPKILKDMRADIGNRINVLNVLLLPPHYDSAIEGQLSSIQQSYANYAIAVENVQVNKEKSTALKALGTPSLAQLVAQCLNTAGTNAGQCIPGSVTKLALSGSPQG